MNGVLGELSRHEDVSTELLFSKQWLGSDGKLPISCPLRDMPFRVFSTPENMTERCWKLLGWPRVDSYVHPDTDWIYCPMESRLPVRKCPVAITIHDIQAFETELPWSHTRSHQIFRRKWASWIYKAIRECRIVFTVSEFTKQRMVTLLGADENKIVVSGNGIAVERLERVQDASESKEVPYILVIGGLREKKGARWTLDAFRALRQQYRGEIELHVAGPNEPLFEAEAREIGGIRLLGWVSDEAMTSLLAKAKALLFLSPYEGFGIPAVEALSLGVPAVVANRTSLPEIVGNASYVVDPERINDVSGLLVELLSENEKFDQNRARNWANRFTWESCADRVLTALHDFS